LAIPHRGREQILTTTTPGSADWLNSASFRSVVWIAAAVLLLACLAIVPAVILRRPFSAEDAYLYLRYALHLRQGHGIAWNPDGVPTYGAISNLWVVVVLLFSYLPFTGEISVQLASWLAGIAALLAMTVAVAQNARSALLRFRPLAFVLVSAPLLLNPRVVYHLTTGMDTMLAMLANALLILAVLRYAARPSMTRAVAVGALGFVAVLARPESILCALATPVAASLWMPGGVRWRELGATLLTLAVLVVAELALCAGYFGVPLPLNFYVISVNAFAGFTTTENPFAYWLSALLCMLPFVGILIGSFSRRYSGPNIAFLLSGAATCAGLLAVHQHMGFQARFYVPFFPYLIVPALLYFDAALTVDARRAVVRALAGIVAAAVIFGVTLPVQHTLDRLFLAKIMARPIAVPPMLPTATAALAPLEWVAATHRLGAIVSALPPQAVVAGVEVGYIGYVAPGRTVIDLGGFNDNDIALNGFSMDRLLLRAPDLMWLPPPDYTGLRAAIVSAPGFLSHYEVIAAAFNYGVAIRRDSPYRPAVTAAVQAAWDESYPQSRMQDYVVTSRSF
jgi:hypothetical protein